MSESALQLLDAAAITQVMPVPEVGDPDFLALPDAPAVVLFESGDGKTILIATTASARDLARRRLSSDPAGRTTHADVRALCAGGCVRVIRVESSLEADAVYLRTARERLPHLARVVAERWRAWFAHVDPDAKHPQWTKTNLMGLVAVRSASAAIEGQDRGVLLGPIPDKDAAGRLIEAVVDAFDLCRYHNLLVQAPNAAPCAYKEMGRCAAPCDGTETMDAYRERVAEIVNILAAGDVSRQIARAEAGMIAASQSQDFTRALAARKQAERLANLVRPAFARVARLDRWMLLLVLPSANKGNVQLAAALQGRVWRLGDTPPERRESFARAARQMESLLAGAGRLAVDADLIDSIGILTRWLFKPEKKRRGVVIEIRDGRVDVEAAMKSAKSLLKKPAEEPLESHEIEAE